jgi:hypothetical protein
VRLFLVLHVAQDAQLATVPKHRELAGVDSDGAIFTGVVDPDHAVNRGLGRLVLASGLHHDTGRRMVAQTAAAVKQLAKIRFIAAMDNGSPGMR